MRAGLLKLALASFMLLLSLLVGEVILRALVDLPMAKPLPQARYEPDPVRRFTLIPGQEGFTLDAPFHLDSSGYRENGPDSPQDADTTILAIGDSFTFGMGVEDGGTWPAGLERRLNAKAGGTFRVLNGGTVSYGVFQELDLFQKRGLRAEPDMVIHGLYWNDFMSAGPPVPDASPALTDAGYFVWDDPTPPSSFLKRTLSTVSNRSALLFTLKRVLFKGARSDGTSAYQAAYERFLEGRIALEDLEPIDDFYREMKALSAEREFEMMVVIFPVVDLVDRPGSGQHPFICHIRAELDQLDIEYIDGFELWEQQGYGRETFLPYNRHLNKAGYEIIAEELDRMISKHIAL